tara:strand:+ start:46 stop:1593 length:1548 start_codon:yes stop_codon:yes gene_type:complete
MFKKPLFLFFYIFFLFGNNLNQTKAYEYFLEAEYLMLINNYIEAEKYYKKALTIYPESITIMKAIADLKSFQGKYDESIYYLNEIMEIEPSNKNSGLNLYQTFIEINNYDKAKDVLDGLKKYYPKDSDILNSLLEIQYIDKNWLGLIETYQIMYENINNDEIIYRIYEIGISTDNFKKVNTVLLELKNEKNALIIIELLAAIAEHEGKYILAIQYMEELINIAGENEIYIINLCELYLRAENFTKIINILEPLYLNGNQSIEILRLLLIAHSMLNNIDKEIVIGKLIINEYPNVKLGYETLYASYYQLGEQQKAIKILLKALSKFPNELFFAFHLSNLFASMGDYNKAEKYFKYTLGINPNFISAKYALALMYEEMEDLNRSDSLFLHLINENQNDAIGLNDYAYVISERQKVSVDELNFAIGLVKNAIKLEPDNPAFLDTLGWIYFKLEMYVEAEQYLQKSLSLNDSNTVILEHMGDVYVKMKKFKDAKKIYNKILSIESDNELIKNKIAKINE